MSLHGIKGLSIMRFGKTLRGPQKDTSSGISHQVAGVIMHFDMLKAHRFPTLGI